MQIRDAINRATEFKEKHDDGKNMLRLIEVDVVVSMLFEIERLHHLTHAEHLVAAQSYVQRLLKLTSPTPNEIGDNLELIDGATRQADTFQSMMYEFREANSRTCSHGESIEEFNPRRINNVCRRCGSVISVDHVLVASRARIDALSNELSVFKAERDALLESNAESNLDPKDWF